MEFQKRILNWYVSNKRDLPWRNTTNPYHILISEVMLQQTQVDRVIPYYEKFLQRFPDLETLANANKQELLEAWSGLGFNSRALRLQQVAQKVLLEHEGIIPAREKALLSLPGIGKYTALAILAFAFNKEVPVLDTNIRRVLIKELSLEESISMSALEAIARENVPVGRSRDWHNALMDYGATVLTAKNTGIKPLSKQSKFEGSERQVRGRIIKHLLQEGRTTTKVLAKAYTHKNFSGILAALANEGFVKLEQDSVSLAP